MEISSTRPLNSPYNTIVDELGNHVKSEVASMQKEKAINQANEELLKAEEVIDRGLVDNSVERMNKAMAALNATLQFTIHEETKRLMVRLVDAKENKVLKEYPPREFLDLVAKIKNMIGVFLDTKV